MKEKTLLKKIFNNNAMKNIAIFLIMVGIVMNFMVIKENNCKMPVLFSAEGYNIQEDSSHIYINDTSNVSYKQLIDKYQIKLKKTIYMLSIGDIFLLVGVIGVIFVSVNEGYLTIKYHKLKKNDKE